MLNESPAQHRTIRGMLVALLIGGCLTGLQHRPTAALAMRQPRQAVLSSTPTAPSSSGLPSSLLSIAAAHLLVVHRMLKDAQPIEIRTSLTPQEIATGSVQISSVFSFFALPHDNVHVTSVSQWFSSAGTVHMAIETHSFIRTRCQGGAQPAGRICNQDTGQPESPQKHLPLRDWKIDLAALVSLLKANTYTPAYSSGATITTAGRAASESAFPLPVLASLPAAQAIILVVEAGVSRMGTGATGHYICFNATTGALIGRGLYALPPPAA